MKQYIIRKFVMANTAEEAIKKSRRVAVADSYVNPDWEEPERPIEGFKKDKNDFK